MELDYIYIVLQTFSLVSGLMVAFSPNPVHSLLYLILCFLNVSLLIAYLGNVFMALIILIIYLGAIAVLFIFIVMMLNIKKDAFNFSGVFSRSIISFIVIIFFAYVYMTFFFQFSDKLSTEELNYLLDNNILVPYFNFLQNVDDYQMVELLGQVIYVRYFIGFILGGLVLLVAMVGAIVISQDKESDPILKQHVYMQISRSAENSLYKMS